MGVKQFYHELDYPYKHERYLVQLLYENRPALLGGVPLGRDDPEAVRMPRSSTPCKLASNQIVVEVHP
jgi:hypothetical protein